MFLFIMLDARPRRHAQYTIGPVLSMLSIMLACDITRWRRMLPFIMLDAWWPRAIYLRLRNLYIDNGVDNARVGYHQMASYFLNYDGDAERKTKSQNRTSNFESTAETCASAPV